MQLGANRHRYERGSEDIEQVKLAKMKSMNAELNTKSIIVHYIHDQAAEVLNEIGGSKKGKMRRGDSFVINKGRAKSTVSEKTQEYIEIASIM